MTLSLRDLEVVEQAMDLGGEPVPARVIAACEAAQRMCHRIGMTGSVPPAVLIAAVLSVSPVPEPEDEMLDDLFEWSDVRTGERVVAEVSGRPVPGRFVGEREGKSGREIHVRLDDHPEPDHWLPEKKVSLAGREE